MVAIVTMASGGLALAEPAFEPAPAGSVPGYSATAMPCTIARDDATGRSTVHCQGEMLEGKTLRELAILRNTIYSRYGWSGYRKPWLKAYFEAQPWFRANPKFSLDLLSEADKKNAHYIATREQQFPEVELVARRRVLSAKPALTAEDRIELALIGRALGEFATEDDEGGASARSLDRLLTPKELRKLSLRDLRILRNTIYARKGRTFKSSILSDHFAGLSWYRARPDYSDRLLSPTDVRNIALIKSVERQLGGPLDDHGKLIEGVLDQY